MLCINNYVHFTLVVNWINQFTYDFESSFRTSLREKLY